jgi:hypothetical protein
MKRVVIRENVVLAQGLTLEQHPYGVWSKSHNDENGLLYHITQHLITKDGIEKPEYTMNLTNGVQMSARYASPEHLIANLSTSFDFFVPQTAEELYKLMLGSRIQGKR